MNRIKTPYIAIAFLFLLAFTACKKERSPRLIVQVIHQGIPVAGALVLANPGDKDDLDPFGVVDSLGVVQVEQTDVAGEAIFEFENSVVLDVRAQFINRTTEIDTLRDALNNLILDSLGNPILDTVMINDTLRGLKIVKLESVRQRDDVNESVEVVEIL